MGAPGWNLRFEYPGPGNRAAVQGVKGKPPALIKPQGLQVVIEKGSNTIFSNG